MVTARDFALGELDGRGLPGWKRIDVRRRMGAPADPRDLGLAEQIVVGVIKNQRYLLSLIEHFSGRKLASIDPLVQKILAIGVYQIRFLERIPVSAAVNEAVEQAKRFGRAKAAGFVNAVLRKAATGPPPALVDRKKEPMRYAEVALSHPRELVGRLVKLVGVEKALGVCEHDNAEPPTIVRLGMGKTAEELEGAGVVVTPHERAGMFVVEGAKKAQLAGWARRGLAQVQDPTAAAVIEHCPIEAGQTVLDRCAGLGTKTMQLWERVGEKGAIVAMDPNVDRMRRLRELLAERKITNASAYDAGKLAEVYELRDRTFDLALVDVPCSNSGVMARRPEARYAQTAQALGTLRTLQTAILADTAGQVRPGGYLVYSTCSIWPEENEGQVAAFLKRHLDFVKQADQTTQPSLTASARAYHDGGYWCLLRRMEDRLLT
jgi:16S rRNA (cytosine967-C5)-methyltransferase